MTRKSLAIASALVMVLLVAVAAAVASSLPGDMPLPTHWGLDGEPDRFSDKWTALLLPLLVAGPVSLIFYFLPALEPRREGLARSQGLYAWAWVSLLLVSVLIQLAVVSVALHWPVHGTSFILAGVGAMFVLIGNQLGKSRSMYLIGIRTPWTLASEEVWIKTHRLAGKLMVGGGLVLVVAAFVPLPNGMIATIMAAVIGAAVLIPIVYSYVLWRRERGSDQASG
jgi:uncharacterized membrane protein